MSNRRKLRTFRKGVAKAEDRRAQGKVAVYDDGRRYNGYQCSPQGGCGAIWLSVDVDKGTTPMFSRCLVTRGCDGMASSMGYPKSPPPKKLPLLVEWYAPDGSSIEDMKPELRDYVTRGGLCRRPGPDAKEWQKNLIGPVFPREFTSDSIVTDGDIERAQLTLIYDEAEEVKDAHHPGESSSSSGDGRGDQG